MDELSQYPRHSNHRPFFLSSMPITFSIILDVLATCELIPIKASLRFFYLPFPLVFYPVLDWHLILFKLHALIVLLLFYFILLAWLHDD